MMHAPGDKVYLDSQPVTVLADAGSRTYYIQGHHDYRVCNTVKLQNLPGTENE
jgi:hypothetical protein